MRADMITSSCLSEWTAAAVSEMIGVKLEHELCRLTELKVTVTNVDEDSSIKAWDYTSRSR